MTLLTKLCMGQNSINLLWQTKLGVRKVNQYSHGCRCAGVHGLGQGPVLPSRGSSRDGRAGVERALQRDGISPTHIPGCGQPAFFPQQHPSQGK